MVSSDGPPTIPFLGGIQSCTGREKVHRLKTETKISIWCGIFVTWIFGHSRKVRCHIKVGWPSKVVNLTGAGELFEINTCRQYLLDAVIIGRKQNSQKKRQLIRATEDH